jgi:hypothetical protein
MLRIDDFNVMRRLNVGRADRTFAILAKAQRNFSSLCNRTQRL